MNRNHPNIAKLQRRNTSSSSQSSVYTIEQHNERPSIVYADMTNVIASLSNFSSTNVALLVEQQTPLTQHQQSTIQNICGWNSQSSTADVQSSIIDQFLTSVSEACKSRKNYYSLVFSEYESFITSNSKCIGTNNNGQASIGKSVTPINSRSPSSSSSRQQTPNNNNLGKQSATSSNKVTPKRNPSNSNNNNISLLSAECNSNDINVLVQENLGLDQNTCSTEIITCYVSVYRVLHDFRYLHHIVMYSMEFADFSIMQVFYMIFPNIMKRFKDFLQTMNNNATGTVSINLQGRNDVMTCLFSMLDVILMQVFFSVFFYSRFVTLYEINDHPEYASTVCSTLYGFNTDISTDIVIRSGLSQESLVYSVLSIVSWGEIQLRDLRNIYLPELEKDVNNSISPISSSYEARTPLILRNIVNDTLLRNSLIQRLTMPFLPTYHGIELIKQNYAEVKDVRAKKAEKLTPLSLYFYDVLSSVQAGIRFLSYIMPYIKPYEYTNDYLLEQNNNNNSNNKGLVDDRYSSDCFTEGYDNSDNLAASTILLENDSASVNESRMQNANDNPATNSIIEKNDENNKEVANKDSSKSKRHIDEKNTDYLHTINSVSSTSPTYISSTVVLQASKNPPLSSDTVSSTVKINNNEINGFNDLEGTGNNNLYRNDDVNKKNSDENKKIVDGFDQQLNNNTTITIPVNMHVFSAMIYSLFATLTEIVLSPIAVNSDSASMHATVLPSTMCSECQNVINDVMVTIIRAIRHHRNALCIVLAYYPSFSNIRSELYHILSTLSVPGIVFDYSYGQSQLTIIPRPLITRGFQTNQIITLFEGFYGAICYDEYNLQIPKAAEGIRQMTKFDADETRDNDEIFWILPEPEISELLPPITLSERVSLKTINENLSSDLLELSQPNNKNAIIQVISDLDLHEIYYSNRWRCVLCNSHDHPFLSPILSYRSLVSFGLIGYNLTHLLTLTFVRDAWLDNITIIKETSCAGNTIVPLKEVVRSSPIDLAANPLINKCVLLPLYMSVYCSNIEIFQQLEQDIPRQTVENYIKQIVMRRDTDPSIIYSALSSKF